MKIRFRFEKTRDMRYISHLDVMRLFQRASRRARIPVTVTKGYNPHFKISLDRALKLGIESRDEWADFYLDSAVSPADFQERLNAELPEGIKVLNAEIL